MRSHHSSQRRLPLVACVACVAFLLTIATLMASTTRGDLFGSAKEKKVPSHNTHQDVPPIGPACRVKISQHCTADESDKVKQSFERIYKEGSWLNGSWSRSGAGSTVFGAFDTITNLTAFFSKHRITSVADVPCGDLSWQMAIPQINTASAYFGGDIADFVIFQNGREYASHLNKAFGHLNIVECNIPMWYTDCDETRRPFEFVIVRDVIQHLHIDRGMKALRRIVFNSSATYLMITSYPSLRWSEDDLTEQCIAGNISSGMFYRNRLEAAPWKLPPPIERWRSHGTFNVIGDDDWTLVYRIADLKPYVEAIANCPWDSLPQGKL